MIIDRKAVEICRQTDEKSLYRKTMYSLYLALAEKEEPGIATEELKTYLRSYIEGGKEPSFDLLPNFCYPMVAGTVAVCKTVPSVWGSLTPLEIEKLDMLMKCMAYLVAIGTDDECHYDSGPGMVGNYNKDWNPNYPLSNIPQILMCIPYFGSAEAVNKLLADFDYDACVAKFKEWGWTNVLSVWVRETDLEKGTVKYRTCDEGNLKEYRYGTIVENDGKGHMKLRVTTSSEDVRAQEYEGVDHGLVDGTERIIDYTTPKAMLEGGGDVYAMLALYRISQFVGSPCGTGIGLPAIGKKGYTYKGFGLDNPHGIWNSLLTYNYSGGIVASEEVPDENGVCQCYIFDRVPSPVNGLPGMMKEFRSGRRSSVGYCSGDFFLCCCTTAVLEALGLYDFTDPVNLPIAKLEWVGNVDFLHKADHGYVSYSGTAVRGAPHPQFGRDDGPGYDVWKAYWEQNVKPRFSKADF